MSGNVARNGGGIARCDGIIRWNTVVENAASGDTPDGRGGGLYSCGGTIENNLVSLNSADWVGGGFDGCGGAIQGNVISDNWAELGGGGRLRLLGHGSEQHDLCK